MFLMFRNLGFLAKILPQTLFVSLSLIAFSNCSSSVVRTETQASPPKAPEQALSLPKDTIRNLDNKIYLLKNYNHLTSIKDSDRTDVAYVVDCDRETSEKITDLAAACRKFKNGLTIRR